MSQHVSNTCDESNGLWLPLTEYSVKTGVSLSTIRRKIKSNSIQYRLEKGRYLILYQREDQKSGFSPLNGVPADINRWQDQPLSRIHQQVAQMAPIPMQAAPAPAAAAVPAPGAEQQLLPQVEKAVALVSDAFEYAVTEKESRIRQLERTNRSLEERVEELKLLVKVLEEKYHVRY